MALFGSAHVTTSDGSNNRDLAGDTLLNKGQDIRDTNLPTMCMDDIWTGIALLPHDKRESEGPQDEIKQSASFIATETEATLLGTQYAKLMQNMENFYCTAYKVPLKDRKMFCGRGGKRELKIKEVKEYGQRYPRFADYKADWWNRTANTLNTIVELTKKHKGSEMIKNAAKTCRYLAIEGLPPLGRNTSATARLHRKIWKDRLLNTEKQDILILEGMQTQAEEQAGKALKEDLAKGRRAYTKWLQDTAKEKPGTIHRITKDAKRYEQEVLQDNVKKHSPTSRIDAKAKTFKELWREGHDDADVQLLKDLRQAAKAEEVHTWTLEQMDQAIRGAPDRGKGVDQMCMTDLRRLPTQGRQEFVDMYNNCEKNLAWPWQILEAIVMLEPKGESQPGPSSLSTGGDRALALLSWMGRCWELLNREVVRDWVRAVQQPWDAAVPGQSCLREAMVRSIGDETADAVGAATAGGLIDIERFYDSVEFNYAVRAARHYKFPLRILAMSMLQHLTSRLLRQEACYSERMLAGRSLLAGSRHSNNIARALVYVTVISHLNEAPRSTPRIWFDDISLRATGSVRAVEDDIVEHIRSLHHFLKEQNLNMADKSVVFGPTAKITQNIVKKLHKKGIKVKAVREGRDLGLERAAKMPRTRATHEARVRKARKRFHLVGKKLRKLGTKPIMRVLEQGAMASLLYGARAFGCSPHEIKMTRRQYAKALRRPWTGRCLSSLLAIEGKDPGITIPKAQIKAWFDMWARHPEIHAAVERAWPKIYNRLKKVDIRARWKARRGIIGSLILQLWEMGWDAPTPTTWTDSEGDTWAMGQGYEADPTDVIDHMMKDVQKKIWIKAAQHRNGKGLEEGADMTDIKKQLNNLQKKSRHQEFGALLVSVCAGTWTGARKAEIFGGEGVCKCGKPDTDFHRLWEDCEEKEEHRDYEDSQHLLQRAQAGAESKPAFWLRGIPPKSWTTPPACDTMDQNSFETITQPRLVGTKQKPLRICGDGSGGEYASDPRYRRCGWAWVEVHDSELSSRGSNKGPLPGPRQSNNRAEMYAMIDALIQTKGPMTFWTDSDLLNIGWQKKKYQMKAYLGGNADLWHKLGKALEARGAEEDEVHVRHIQSHLSREEAELQGYPIQAWWGNRQADILAGEAADEHAIPRGQMACYEWVNAVGMLIRRRMYRSTLQAIIKNPSMTMEDKELKRKQKQYEKDQMKEKEDIEELIKNSLHVLSHKVCLWHCKACAESCVDYGKKDVLKTWLKKKCAGHTAGTRNQKHQVQAGGHLTHGSHDMRRAVRAKRWFCWNCAASFDGEGKCRISGKLMEACDGRATKGMEHKLKAYRNQAER